MPSIKNLFDSSSGSNGNSPTVSIKVLKEMLIQHIPGLLKLWYPNGEFRGSQFRVGDVDGTRGGSLSVELYGERAGLWIDHAEQEGGDILALWQKRYDCSFMEALRAAEQTVNVVVDRKKINGEYRRPLTYKEVMRELGNRDDAYLAVKTGEELQAELDEQKKRVEDSKIFGNLTHGLDHIPPVNWLIEYWIPAEQCLIEIFGVPGSGKSLAILDIALCVASGERWAGFKPQHTGPVVYICGEGHWGLKRRIRAWFDSRGLRVRELPIFGSRKAIRFGNLKNQEDILEAVDEISQVCDEAGSPALIAIDTLARNMFGNENDQQDMGNFVHDVEMHLRNKFNSPVLISHHPGWGDKDRGRGASSLPGALDVVYQADLVIEDDSKIIKLHCPLTGKAPKDWDIPLPIHFAIKKINLPFVDHNNQPQTSVFLKKLDDYEEEENRKSISSNKSKTPTKDKVEKALELMIHRRIRNGDGCWAYTTHWRDACQSEGVSSGSFRNQKSALIKDGIVIEDGELVTLKSLNV